MKKIGMTAVFLCLLTTVFAGDNCFENHACKLNNSEECVVLETVNGKIYIHPEKLVISSSEILYSLGSENYLPIHQLFVDEVGVFFIEGELLQEPIKKNQQWFWQCPNCGKLNPQHQRNCTGCGVRQI